MQASHAKDQVATSRQSVGAQLAAFIHRLATGQWHLLYTTDDTLPLKVGGSESKVRSAFLKTGSARYGQFNTKLKA